MQYPIGDPILATSGPLLNETSELGIIHKYMDCNTFPDEFRLLDTSNAGHPAGYLSLGEFEENFLSQIPNKQMIAANFLNASVMFCIADLNRDGLLSYEEFVILRHFWTPFLLSSTAPAPIDNENTLAKGPLGGVFVDNSTVSVWVVTANNLLLRLYIANGWSSARTRQPQPGEELFYQQNADLDGSTRISLEEQYFRVFADINHDGVLERWEYDLSLYDKNTSAGGGFEGWATWSDHDLNNDGVITFIERKRIFADRNADNFINLTEWKLADFPSSYGPYQGHKGSNGMIGKEEYAYYSLYHSCTLRSSTAYASYSSSYPWSSQCPLFFSILNDTSFFLDSSRREEFALGQLEVDSDLSGLAYRVLSNVTRRLGWQGTLRVVPNSHRGLQGEAVDLSPYNVTAPNIFTRSFNLAVLTQYASVPSGWLCSSSLWPDDGLSVVVRSQDESISLYKVLAEMIVSPQFINFFCSLFFTVLIVGHVIWIIERWNNETIFRRFYAEGVIDGLWWAMVTMTTVGYGDKAPATEIGKLFGIFWLIFGLIVFGTFSSQVTSFIGDQLAVNNIVDADSLAGFSVGVLNRTSSLNLDLQFGFTSTVCDSVKVCLEQLASNNLDAALLPRADVVNYFRSSKLAFTVCGNKLKFVGGLVTNGVVVLLQPAVRVCAYGQSVFAATYLLNAVDSMVQTMTQDGTMSSIVAESRDFVYPPTVTDSSCTSPSSWNVPLIIVALLLLFLYACLVNILDGGVLRSILSVLLPSLFPPVLVEEERASAILRQPSFKKRKLNTSSVEFPQPLRKKEVEPLVHASKLLGVFSAMQSSDIRSINQEVSDYSHVLQQVARLFIFCFILLLVIYGILLGILAAAWGSKLQVRKP
uniref:Calmodulin n=1 Tax=Hanusia phi TaxID=3032 RepID=A0A7S0HCK3_9CRYP